MDSNDIVHCYSLSGRTDAELVIESKYHALGLTAETGYDVDIFRVLDMNTNKISNLATPTTDYDASTKKYVDDAPSNDGVYVCTIIITSLCFRKESESMADNTGPS